LVTLAEAGQGIAVVPSTMRFGSRKVLILPLLRAGKSLGTWGGVAWDPRRSLPVYAASFMEELTAFAARSSPGKRFAKRAPPLPRPE
jgi:hypothetical protein